MIEEAHELALAVLREHMDELHKISSILIERETIDRDQFERLLAGEDEGTVFPDEAPAEAEQPEPQTEPKPSARGRVRSRCRARRCGAPIRPTASRRLTSVRDPSRIMPTADYFIIPAPVPCSVALFSCPCGARADESDPSSSCRKAGRRRRTARFAARPAARRASQARARSSAARSVGSPCAGSTTSTGRSSNGREPFRHVRFGHVLAAAELDPQPVAEVRRASRR